MPYRWTGRAFLIACVIGVLLVLFGVVDVSGHSFGFDAFGLD